MKDNRINYDLERKLRRYAIGNLMKYIVIGQGIVFALMYIWPTLGYRLYSLISLTRAGLMRGQIWRLVTFVFTPPSSSPIFILFALYFYYMIGTALENRWGARRFLIYYVIGALANVAGAFIAHLLTGYGIGLNTYLYYSLFIAFAALYPDMQFMLFFCLPVKAKWLAAIDLLYFLVAIVAGPAQIRCAAIASLVNVALFFGEDIYKMARIQYAQWKRRRMFRQ